MTEKPATIDGYIAAFPNKVQILLQEVRRAIHEAEPAATEAIGYAMPTFRLDGKNLAHFAAFSKHIGFYATPHNHRLFADELSRYHVGKGSVRFPIERPLPLGLIKQMVRARAEQLIKVGEV